MADVVSKLRWIDPESKLIVNGFIRESQKLLPFEESPYYNLTELIVQLCLIYYAINEYWDKFSSDFITENDKCIIKRVNNSHWNATVLGQQILPSIGNIIYEWYFNIVKLKHGASFIGICDSKFDDVNQAVRWTDYLNYMYYGSRGRIAGNKFSERVAGQKYKEGDIVSMRLNTKQGIIEFYKQSKEDKDRVLSGKMKFAQKKELSYKMCCMMYYCGDHIKLAKFQTITV